MNFFENLTHIPTASGAEENVASAIKEYLSPYASDIRTDKCGNLIIILDGGEKDGKTEKTAVFVPMDAPGLIVTYIEDDGRVRVSPLGNCDWRSVCFARVTNGKITGFISPDAADSDGIAKSHVCFGFKDRKEAEAHIRQGNILCFEPAPLRLENGLISGVGLGTKALATAACLAAEKVGKVAGKCFYFVFCTQSALNSRGSYQAAFGISAENALCLETHSGKSFAVKVLDKSVVCDEKLTSLAEECAHKYASEVKRIVSSDGLCDASRVECAYSGTKTAVVLMPAKHRGTLSETISSSDIEDLSDITAEFLRNI